MSNWRIKQSIVPIIRKIRNQEFSRNWNSGIPEKKRKKEKNPIPTSPQGGTKDLFQGFFHHPRGLKKEQ
jgi:hypothetical protein